MKKIITSVLVASLFVVCAGPTFGADAFKVAWSHYTGWEPWAYADEFGVLKKWADKYGIQIELSPPIDYIESINLYTAGEYQACVMTNMDMLTIPCVGGIDSTALIIGDFSNGNDGIVLKNGSSVADLKNRKVRLVELSVSHYLLGRALEKASLSERDLTLINTSDSDIAPLFITDTDPKAACVTWNPLLLKVAKVEKAALVFDSSEIPGEIIDMMVVRTDAPDTLKKALVGAWYETMRIMSPPRSPKGKEAIQFMAKKAGGTEEEYLSQLRTTQMFYNAREAADFAMSPQLKNTMQLVRSFCFDHGLYGLAARSKDAVGIAFPDGSLLGDKGNVKLRFDASYMQLAAKGEL